MNSFRNFIYTNFFSVLDRYFYTQLFSNYLIGLSFFSSIIMINELYYIIRYYFEQNVPLFHVMSMMGAMMPYLISFSVPFGVLPAYLLLMGQLSQDSEIVSMRACGISAFRIMWPGIIFGCMIMIFAYNFKNRIETYYNEYYIQLKTKVLAQKPVIQLLDNVFLNIGSVKISFERTAPVEGSEDILYNVYAVDVENRRTIRADEGRIYVDPDNPEHYVMKFLNGDMNQITFKTNYLNSKDPTNSIDSTNVTDIVPESELDIREEFYLTSFGSMTLHNYVWLPDDNYLSGPETFTYKELSENIQSNPKNAAAFTNYQKILSNKNQIDKIYLYSKIFPKFYFKLAQDTIDQVGISNYIERQQETIAIMHENAKQQLIQGRAQLPNYSLMKLYDKVVLPVSALVFAILCLPLGMFSARSGRGEGLSISLVVVLVFYGFKSFIENMINQNKIPPELIWIPTIVFAVIAFTLFFRKIYE